MPKILDCTIRDGGYITNWNFDRNMVRETYRAISKSGVEMMEIGYLGSEKYLDKNLFGPWRFTTEDMIKEVVAGISGAKLAIMIDYGKADIEDFLDAKESQISLVRVAVHKNNITDAIRFLEKIKQKGYEVSLNAMGFSNFSKKEIDALIPILKNSGIDYIYVVDSYGSLFPTQIKRLLEPLFAIGNIKVGFHPHNSLQMAFANTLEAIRCGVDIVDTTLYGIGRGAGNLPTEIIVLYLELLGIKKYNVIPILNCIDTYLLPLKKEYDWGYQLPFMLSGMYRCHPNYAKKLVEFREYTIEDICKAMELIRIQNPIGYSEELLEDFIKRGLIGRLKIPKNKQTVSVKKGISKQKINVDYKDRHRNRDFLILANGPTLKEYKERIDIFIKKIDPIIMGANNLSGLFIPYYHAFNNKKRFIKYIETVSEDSILLISEHFSEQMIREYTNRNYERLYYYDTLEEEFDIKDGVITTNCRTISVLLIGVAIVMGARRIFIAGMDGYLHYKPGQRLLYYDEKDEKTDIEMIRERHMWCHKFLEQIDSYLTRQGKEGIHILTPTAYRAFYKGIENYISHPQILKI